VKADIETRASADEEAFMWRPYWAVSALAIVAVVTTADLSGTWDVDVSFDDPAVEGGDIDCVIKHDGDQLKGTCSDGTAALAGQVSGQTVRWRIGANTFNGTLDETGTRVRGRFTAGGKDGSFTALKSK
jgi:hypothetical protein